MANNFGSVNFGDHFMPQNANAADTMANPAPMDQQSLRISQLEQLVAIQADTLDMLQPENAQLKSQLQQLNAAVGARNAEIENLKKWVSDEKGSFKGQLDHALVVNQNISAQLEPLHQQNEELKQRNDQLAEQVAFRTAEMEEELKQKDAKIAGLRKAINEKDMVTIDKETGEPVYMKHTYGWNQHGDAPPLPSLANQWCLPEPSVPEAEIRRRRIMNHDWIQTVHEELNYVLDCANGLPDYVTTGVFITNISQYLRKISEMTEVDWDFLEKSRDLRGPGWTRKPATGPAGRTATEVCHMHALNHRSGLCRCGGNGKASMPNPKMHRVMEMPPQQSMNNAAAGPSQPRGAPVQPPNAAQLRVSAPSKQTASPQSAFVSGPPMASNDPNLFEKAVLFPGRTMSAQTARMPIVTSSPVQLPAQMHQPSPLRIGTPAMKQIATRQPTVTEPGQEQVSAPGIKRNMPIEISDDEDSSSSLHQAKKTRVLKKPAVSQRQGIEDSQQMLPSMNPQQAGNVHMFGSSRQQMSTTPAGRISQSHTTSNSGDKNKTKNSGSNPLVGSVLSKHTTPPPSAAEGMTAKISLISPPRVTSAPAPGNNLPSTQSTQASPQKNIPLFNTKQRPPIFLTDGSYNLLPNCVLASNGGIVFHNKDGSPIVDKDGKPALHRFNDVLDKIDAAQVAAKKPICDRAKCRAWVESGLKKKWEEFRKDQAARSGR